MSAPPRIVYVCTSNTCRSPMAMHLARARAADRGLSGAVDIVSRGLTDRYSAWGSPADPRAAAALGAATGLSSDGHGSKALTAADVDGAAVLFYFTDEHVGWIAGSVGEAPVRRALDDGRLRKVDPAGGDVPDPFFGDDAFYREVCALMVACVAATLDAALAEILR